MPPNRRSRRRMQPDRGPASRCKPQAHAVALADGAGFVGDPVAGLCLVRRAFAVLVDRRRVGFARLEEIEGEIERARGGIVDAATTRIERFVAQAPKAGRTEILMAGDWELTLVGPDRYRGEILTAIAADARRTADAFGDRYAVQVEGLARRVTWTQSGPLDLSLFIPYQLTVTPAGS